MVGMALTRPMAIIKIARTESMIANGRRVEVQCEEKGIEKLKCNILSMIHTLFVKKGL
jgi:hypothetical protein